MAFAGVQSISTVWPVFRAAIAAVNPGEEKW
jgi:hypothetical protein